MNKCPRCVDLFYHPKTLIECEKQRADEWEERYRVAKDKIRELEIENLELKFFEIKKEGV